VLKVPLSTKQTNTPSSLSAIKLANPGSPGKLLLKWRQIDVVNIFISDLVLCHGWLDA